VDREAFEIPRRRRSTPSETSDQAAAAVLRTESSAAARGHRLHSIGVTWSEDARTEASLLLKSLTECGFDNVVPVRMPDATEALAWGVAEMVGHNITAVCVVESQTVIALVVHTRQGAVQTAVNHAIDSEEALVRWLSAIFVRADWQPQALVVVGSGGGDVDALLPRLEKALSVPVFAPAEAELALARGAALASAHTNELVFDDVRLRPRREQRARAASRRPVGQAGPLAMLVAGAVTFVVSASVAISLEITPTKETAPLDPRPAGHTLPGVAAAAESVPLAPPRTAVSVPVADSPLDVTLPQAPPVEVPPEAPAGVVEAAAGPAAMPDVVAPPEAALAPPGAPVEAASPDPALAPPPPPPAPVAPPADAPAPLPPS
jgi:hypothetical protein